MIPYTTSRDTAHCDNAPQDLARFGEALRQVMREERARPVHTARALRPAAGMGGQIPTARARQNRQGPGAPRLLTALLTS
ncbi:hypothetical protein AB0D57_47840 [Streptomyces sp. NPDC048275]|uniref:hypothetical protein n=1 Tax=Streptomyces sp. NPDC048275 TaxID=3155629 RepID=UPI0034009D36